jgi:6-phosphofructokinase 1
MRIGVCTGGGDCPGLNAALRAIVKSCRRKNFEIFGIKDCFQGLKARPPWYRKLDIEDVTDIYFKGGTILGTFNRSGRKDAEMEESIRLIIEGYHLLKLDCLLVIGGEGTQSVAKVLAKKGLKIIGIPKTIDNDLPQTDRTIGFSTCVDLVSESVFRLQSTAESHDRVMILEVMGRDSGFIGLYGGMAGGADIILIPEIAFSYKKIFDKILERKKLGRNYSVIVVSEGAKASKEDALSFENTISQAIAKKISTELTIETRVTVLGHLQRGGTPNPYDRLLATRLGVFATELIVQKKFGVLLALNHGKMHPVDYDTIKIHERQKVSINDPTLVAAETIGISFGR